MSEPRDILVIEDEPMVTLAEAGEDRAKHPCAIATSPDGSRHGIMCPLSGKVLEVNEDARSKPTLVEKDPYCKGWLFRILSWHPESNLHWLSL